MIDEKLPESVSENNRTYAVTYEIDENTRFGNDTSGVLAMIKRAEADGDKDSALTIASEVIHARRAKGLSISEVKL